MAMIVISVPSVGVVIDNKLSVDFLKKVAQLTELHPDISFVNPMVEGYSILPYLSNQEATWNVWGQYCERLIKKSDGLWVLQFDGWDSSIGVANEIAIAEKFGIIVRYFKV